MITVKIFGTLSLDLGQSRLELDSAGSTLAEIIDQMTDRYGTKVREELLDEEGNLDYAYGILNNGEQVTDLATRVQEGMELVIVNMIGGG